MLPILGHCSQGKPGSTYVCTGTTEPLLTPKTLRDSLKAVCKKLDLPILKFQDLRHNFTVRCIRSGCDFVTLMHLLVSPVPRPSTTTTKTSSPPTPPPPCPPRRRRCWGRKDELVQKNARIPAGVEELCPDRSLINHLLCVSLIIAILQSE